ncbi:MAG TPA: hypothetical protein ENN13_02440 [Candidatus Altiarchaeales archaeon]|nr:hypothetical protein [Candidatus Altiarchaeales archaeon]
MDEEGFFITLGFVILAGFLGRVAYRKTRLPEMIFMIFFSRLASTRLLIRLDKSYQKDSSEKPQNTATLKSRMNAQASSAVFSKYPRHSWRGYLFILATMFPRGFVATVLAFIP